MARAGSNHKGGRPRGYKSKKSLEKDAVMRALREKILRASDTLFISQFGLAKGLTFLYKIETVKGVKQPAELVEDIHTIEAFLNDELNEQGDSEWYFMSTQKPENKAIDSMFDRVFGKAMQTTEVSGKDGGPIVFVPMELMDKYKLNDPNASAKSDSKRRT